jgi:hypothetical protein
MSSFIISECTDDPYTIVPNFIINDPTLSVYTKMTWIFLFSKRHVPGWKVHPKYIQKILGFSDKIWRKVYKDLTAMNYLSMRKTQQGTILIFNYDWKYKNNSVDNE